MRAAPLQMELTSASSERIDPAQLELLLQLPAAADAQPHQSPSVATAGTLDARTGIVRERTTGGRAALA